MGKRVLVTQARDFMGPALVEVFREHGAIVATGTPEQIASCKASHTGNYLRASLAADRERHAA